MYSNESHKNQLILIGDNFFRGISNGRVTVDDGQLLPVGTYYYLIRYDSDQSVTKRLAGPLYINRK